MGKWTRRAALGMIFGGAGVFAQDTVSFSSTETDRSVGAFVGDDGNALLTLVGVDPDSATEPHKITVTNQTEQTFNSIKITSGSQDKFNFRDTENSTNKDPLRISDLSISSLAPGNSHDFFTVTAPDETGDVTGIINFQYGGSGTSIELERTLTIRFKSGGRLVYAIDGDIRVYDSVNDTELSPPDDDDAKIIGANAVDFTGSSNADIPFLSSNRNGFIATEVGADSDNQFKSNPDPQPKNQKTRLTSAQWDGLNDCNAPEIGTIGDGENAVYYADGDADAIYAINGSGAVQEVADPGNGASAVISIVDFDNDGREELLFIDSSSALRSLNPDRTTEKIQNSDIGSNNSVGAGPVADFGNGLKMPVINGSQNVAVLDIKNESQTRLTGNSPAKKAACAPVDVDNDGAFEIVFLGNQNGQIKYVDDVGGSNTVKKLTVGTGVNGGTDVTRKADVTVGLNSGVDVTASRDTAGGGGSNQEVNLFDVKKVEKAKGGELQFRITTNEQPVEVTKFAIDANAIPEIALLNNSDSDEVRIENQGGGQAGQQGIANRNQSGYCTNGKRYDFDPNADVDNKGNASAKANVIIKGFENDSGGTADVPLDHTTSQANADLTVTLSFAKGRQQTFRFENTS